ncbi:FAD-dependent 5-carboxymethylaminomethyl-2-thiouridine(34) oxidoreductase MnmC [Snodgrassella sp. CFCC 13594]|uniref:FAD-dependent 5-carboxymethylaminomethyl-2-thiouridine(34) oxidoreductase MnmC n=1 Tax=Snodgrassella sp. CFCC 13594 TaxID=1775559 RepID=UPI00082B3640|nr:FAD-dependent 5-carboxymethylaminomethyl-2-thiouridine(34) oxidoreductase MnmC [Snodgrassella sp. CFCC 13594]
MMGINQCWHHWPSMRALWEAHLQAPMQHQTWLIISDHWLPEAANASPNTAPEPLQSALQLAQTLYQHQPVFCIPQFLSHVRLLLIHPDHLDDWQANFAADAAPKPWLHLPHPTPMTHVMVVGAGIAGAATAYALAVRGISVTVIDSGAVAHAASGNRQGLLYAKISAHNTIQSELLLAGYAYSRQLLSHILPMQQEWQACGVLHLDYNEQERRRNQALATQSHSGALYDYINAATASQLAGIRIHQNALWWPQGVSLHPPAWVHGLLKHPLIQMFEHTRMEHMRWHNNEWLVHTQTPSGNTHIAASHVVLCTGAQSGHIGPMLGWPFQRIRGQTTVAAALPGLNGLRCALSGASYVSPPWQDKICFGASFAPGNDSDAMSQADNTENWQQLSHLIPDLAAECQMAQAKTSPLAGHAAVRCDAYDHLPVVGPIGDAAAMRAVYAKLANDKNLPLQSPCPFVPNLFVNSAHGSRGLATAPLCSEALAAMMLGEASPLSARVQQALLPNRLVIRALTHHTSWPI